METSLYSQTLEFESPRLLSQLYCGKESHLSEVEKVLDVTLVARDDWLKIEGAEAAVHAAAELFQILRLARAQGLKIRNNDFEKMLEAVADGKGTEMRELFEKPLIIQLKRKSIVPKTVHQKQYLTRIRQHDVSFGIGPAGTGKTFLAVAQAVSMMVSGKIERIILSRPAVEAGERLGFLPGDIREKIDPYLRPLYDALYQMLPADAVVNKLTNGEIEIAPLAFMRGRTLTNCFVILDEAQNTTDVQMKMFLTRLGENSRMALTGDLSQVDLPKGVRSGLRVAVDVLDGVEGVAMTEFTSADVVRHPLVTRIVEAYQAHEEKTKKQEPYE